MNKTKYIPMAVAIYTPLYTCGGCGASLPALIQSTEIHRRSTGARVQFVDGVPDGAHLAIGYNPPDGWEQLAPPFKQSSETTDYFCAACVAIIRAIINGALTTAITAIRVNNLNTNAEVPALVLPPDPRQVVIPHEYTTTMYNAPPNTISCDICGLLEKECREKQTALIA